MYILHSLNPDTRGIYFAATGFPADVGRYPGGDRRAPRLARRGDVPSPVNPDRSEQRGLASRLRDILATSVRPVNSAIHCCAYSRALATFSCIPGTTRSVLIRTGAGAKWSRARNVGGLERYVAAVKVGE